MPTYFFRTLPFDGEPDVQLDFDNDEAALVDARRALGDLLHDQANTGKSLSKDIEVVRADSSVVGRVTSGTD
jgi:hypothetical protein